MGKYIKITAVYASIELGSVDVRILLGYVLKPYEGVDPALVEKAKKNLGIPANRVVTSSQASLVEREIAKLVKEQS